jgi:hypothetical protein
MGSILNLIFPALVPAVADGVRGLIGKFTGNAGAQPQNVAETVQLMEAETKRVQALADLDKMPDGADKWVINLRGAFRYVVTGGIVASAVGGTFAQLDPVFLALLYDMAGASMSFIIGERMYLNLKGAGK